MYRAREKNTRAKMIFFIYTPQMFFINSFVGLTQNTQEICGNKLTTFHSCGTIIKNLKLCMEIKMKQLNEEKLKKMEEYIRYYMHDNNGDAPSFAEICTYMDMTKSVCYRYLMALKDRGIVEYTGRGTLKMNGSFTAKTELVRAPILGKVICGTPEEEHQHAEGYITVPEDWAGKNCFFLRAYGNSMVDAGIDIGDLVLVERTSSARNGNIVVALTENGNTLKRIFWEDGKPRLHVENSKYNDDERDIYPSELTIQGVAVKVIKDLKY